MPDIENEEELMCRRKERKKRRKERRKIRRKERRRERKTESPVLEEEISDDDGSFNSNEDEADSVASGIMSNFASCLAGEDFERDRLEEFDFD